MITVKPHSPQIPTWQSLWRDSIRDPEELLELLGLQGFSGLISAQAQGQFALRVPRGFAAKMRAGDLEKEKIDLTAPALPKIERGHLHPLTIVQNDLEKLYSEFDRYAGPH